MPDQISRGIAIFEALQSLQRISKALPLGELSQKMCLHPSTITGVVDRLEKKGYVSRDRDREDRRVVMVQLTPKGKRLVKRDANPVQGRMIHGLRQLRKEKLDFILESVQTLVGMMEAQHLKGTFFFDQESGGKKVYTIGAGTDIQIAC